MKYTIAFALLAIITLGIASCSNETTSDNMSQLPQSIQNTVADNFTSNVLSVTTENNSFGEDEYEIILADGSKIKFEGEAWEEISVPNGQSVPEVFVLEPIQSYMAQNLPDQTIVKIEKDKKGYEIKLSNGMEIDFDTAGNFVKID